MSNILSRWFNLPLQKDLPAIMDDRGSKFWIYLSERVFFDRIDIGYYGKTAGHAYILPRQNKVELGYIYICPPFRAHNLGSAFFQFLLNLVKAKGAVMFFGLMQPEDGHTIEELAHFYEKQGAVVDLDRRIFRYKIR